MFKNQLSSTDNLELNVSGIGQASRPDPQVKNKLIQTGRDFSLREKSEGLALLLIFASQKYATYGL